MAIPSKFVHANLVALDWRKLAEFYQRVFGCIPIPPERDLSGEWLEGATGVLGAEIRGIHLRLPGYGDRGPTLEIFRYNHLADHRGASINRPGLAHLAFSVEDVKAAREAVVEAGGGIVGDLVSIAIPGAGEVSFVYVTDPEGNIIELQRWSKEGGYWVDKRGEAKGGFDSDRRESP